MRTYIALVGAAVLLHCGPHAVFAQMNAERERAQIKYRIGWENMRAEAWEKAVQSFQETIDIDPTYELAYYMLGRANMPLKRYGQAIAAYSKCRDLYQAQAARQFTSQQEVHRYRQDRVMEIDDTIRQLQVGSQTAQT